MSTCALLFFTADEAHTDYFIYAFIYFFNGDRYHKSQAIYLESKDNTKISCVISSVGTNEVSFGSHQTSIPTSDILVPTYNKAPLTDGF